MSFIEEVPFSGFGKKFTQYSGIYQLMQDLDAALNQNPEILFLGGGNPAAIEPARAHFQREFESIAKSQEKFHKLVGVYDNPRGNSDFLDDLATYLSKALNSKITRHNIALTNGSQNSFFLLFNLLAGQDIAKKILLPLLPEYIGYNDVGLSDNLFLGIPGQIDIIEENRFKYKLDYGRLEKNSNLGLMCISRPSNPTSNVVSEEEIATLQAYSITNKTPLLIDAAYGFPFPNVQFVDSALTFSENTIISLSLSKLGLPGVRTGIIVAHERITKAIEKINAIMNLAVGSLGPNLIHALLKDSAISKICNEHIQPFYRQKSNDACAYLGEQLKDIKQHHIHANEGAFFLWLWLKNLPITSVQLYERLKQRNIVVVTGDYFFAGATKEKHHSECLRISFAQPKAIVKKGIEIIADEVKKAYAS